MMIDAPLASAEVGEPSGAVGALDRARGIDDRELLDSYSRAVVAVVEHVGPAGVSIAAGSRASGAASGLEARPPRPLPAPRPLRIDRPGRLQSGLSKSASATTKTALNEARPA